MSDLGNKQVMADNIKRLMKEFNVSQSDICTRLNLKPSTFSDWVNAKTYPRIDKIEMLANYFGVEKSDLIENKTVKASSTVTVYNAVNISQRMNETECQLMLDYWDLDDHGKKAIHTIMNLEHERCTKESNLRNDLTILKPCSKRQACLMQVQIYDFATHELNLYLDTHPGNTKMLALFKEYNECAKKARMEYEQHFGPLTVSAVHAEKTPWIWIQGPWPWERQ